MAEPGKKRHTVKLLFWAVVAVGLGFYWVESYTTGQMVSWYYYTAKSDGYAINDHTFDKASKDKPILLEVGKFDKINGPQAVPIKKGERMPAQANGIIDAKVLKDGKRAVLEGGKIKVMIPSEIKEAKGFKYKDTFKHKGVKTNPWSGLWNVGMVVGFGFALGMVAEAFTDFIGFKPPKSVHH